MADEVQPDKLIACSKCGLKVSPTLTHCPRDRTPLHSQPDDGEPIVEQPDDVVLFGPGSKIDGRYEIVELLGVGGMGSVYKARHMILATTLAIKFLHPQKVLINAVERFKLEAKAASQLKHPNIVSIIDFGVAPEGVPYIVMEFLDGSSLASTIEQSGPLDTAHFIRVFEQVCDALSLAHKQGIIHRDLKPENIVLTRGGNDNSVVKIVDFGLAKLLPQDGTSSPRLTKTGEIFGTPVYMSPEQCMGTALDARSDIYSLGCVMYEALTGKQPFQGETSMQLMYLHVHGSPSFDADMTVSRKLQELTLKCMKKDPAARYQSIDDLWSDIQRIKHGEKIALPALPGSANAKTIFVSAGAGIAAVAIAIGLWMSGQPRQEAPLKNTAPVQTATPVIHEAPKTEDASQPASALELFMIGTRRVEEGRLVEGIAEFDKAIALDKRYEEALSSRAKAYYALQQYNKATEDYNRIIALHPPSARVLMARADTYLHAGEWDKAIADCKLAAKLDPINPDYYYRIGEAYSGKGNHKESVASYSRVIELTPNDSTAYRNRGSQYYHLKRYTDSLKDFDKSISISTTDANAYAGRGLVYEEMGKYKEALADFNRALETERSMTWVLTHCTNCKNKLAQSSPTKSAPAK